jgi:hypothetical protein
MSSTESISQSCRQRYSAERGQMSGPVPRGKSASIEPIDGVDMHSEVRLWIDLLGLLWYIPPRQSAAWQSVGERRTRPRLKP